MGRQRPGPGCPVSTYREALLERPVSRAFPSSRSSLQTPSLTIGGLPCQLGQVLAVDGTHNSSFSGCVDSLHPAQQFVGPVVPPT